MVDILSGKMTRLMKQRAIGDMNIGDILLAIFIICVGGTKGGPGIWIAFSFWGKFVAGIGCLALLFKILGTKYTKKELAVIGIIGFFGVMNALYTGQMGILLVAFFIMGMKDVSLRKIFSLMLGIQIILFVLGVVPDLIMIAAGGEVRGVTLEKSIMGVTEARDQFRVGLGFIHPNAFQQNIAFISMLTIYLFQSKIRIWHLAILLAANIGFYALTYSNTGLAVFIIYFMLYLLYRYQYHIAGFMGICSRYIFLVLVAVNLYIAWAYSPGNHFYDKLNRFMVGRLVWSHEYLNAVGLTWWGRDIMKADLPYKYLDNGYMVAILGYGCVVFVLYCVMVYRLLRVLYETEQFLAIFMIGAVHIYFIMETFMMSALLNYTFVFFAGMIYTGQFMSSEHK